MMILTNLPEGREVRSGSIATFACDARYVWSWTPNGRTSGKADIVAPKV